MRRLGGNHENATMRIAGSIPDDDPLRGQHGHVEPADGLNAQESLFVDMRNEETDLVGVRREHHPWTTCALADAGDISKGIDRHLIADGPQLVTHQCGNLPLASRDSRCFTEPLEQVDIQIGHEVSHLP